jgi:hypothetical protein
MFQLNQTGTKSQKQEKQPVDTGGNREGQQGIEKFSCHGDSKNNTALPYIFHNMILSVFMVCEGAVPKGASCPSSELLHYSTISNQ